MTTLAKCWEAYRRDVLPKVVDQRRVEGVIKAWLERAGTKSVLDVDWHGHAARMLAHKSRPATLAREFNVLRAVMNHARKLKLLRGDVPELPVFTAPSTAQGLPQDDVKAIVRRARSHPALDIFVKIALATGARPGAILGLTWDRVDFGRKIIDFKDPAMSKQGRRKGRALVPMSGALSDFLIERKAREIGTGTRLDCVVPRCHLNRLWRKHIKISRPHALRHTVATEVARRFGLLAAANMLGHKSVRTTEQVYVHIQADHLREAAEALSTMTGSLQSR